MRVIKESVGAHEKPIPITKVVISESCARLIITGGHYYSSKSTPI